MSRGLGDVYKRQILGSAEIYIGFKKHLFWFVSAFVLMDWMRNSKYSHGCLRDSWEIPYFVPSR